MKRKKNSHQSLVEDKRAQAVDLPIPLIIALVVGVAVLVLMLSVLGTFDEDSLGDDELTVNITEGSTVTEGSSESLKFTVVNGQGESIEEVEQVILEPDTARGDTYTVSLGPDRANTTVSNFNSATSATLGANQNTGTYQIRPIDNTNAEFDTVDPKEVVIIDN